MISSKKGDKVIKLKLERHDQEKFVSLNSKMYEFVEEPRGVREKFWLIQAKSKFFRVNLKDSNILFKYNRNDVSCENWGEVISSKVAKQIGMPCVDYFLAEYEHDGETDLGVICGTYKKNENEIEMSAHDVQIMYSDYVENINTVDDIIEKLMTIVPENKDASFYHKQIRNAMIKQIIFDFILAQTDRHWFNTTFLVYTRDDVFNIRMAESYDNGCIAFLKRKISAIEGISREILKQGKKSVRLHDLLDDYVPMMGITTPTVQLNKSKGDDELKKLKVVKSRREVFLDELTKEILNNPDIAVFYNNLKYHLNIDDIASYMAHDKMPIPNPVVDMVKIVSNYQISVLDELLHEKINRINAEEILEVN